MENFLDSDFGHSLRGKQSLGVLGRVAMGCDLHIDGILLAAVSDLVLRSRGWKQLGIDSHKSPR